MRDLAMQGYPSIEMSDMILLSMFAPFYAVSTDLQGICYSVFYYEKNIAPREERVKMIIVDGVQPEKGTIRTRQYPYTTEVYAVIRENQPKSSLAYQLRD